MSIQGKIYSASSSPVVELRISHSTEGENRCCPQFHILSLALRKTRKDCISTKDASQLLRERCRVVGRNVGCTEGWRDGCAVGKPEGCKLGWQLGWRLG